MTKSTYRALRDCTAKINNITPTEDQIQEMLSFLSKMDRLAEVCDWEGPSGLRLEAAGFPENAVYEKAFKESIYMWMDGATVGEATDHAADRYFDENPSGYDAAVFFAAVFSVSAILEGGISGFIDRGLQYLLPDGWRWVEENNKEAEAHKGEKDWFPFEHDHRREFLGDPRDEVKHRFDDIRVCDLVTTTIDEDTRALGRKIADRLPEFRNGALQLIMKQLTYTELEKALYALPMEAEDRIMSNLSSYCIPIIKGNCILNKDTVSLFDIRMALTGFEQAVNNYDGDPLLEAEYED